MCFQLLALVWKLVLKQFTTQYDIFVMNIICSLCKCLIILDFERGLAIPSDIG